MTGNITITEVDRLLDAMMGTAAYTAPTTPIKQRLMAVNGDHTTAGTEVAGGTYVGQTVTAAGATGGTATGNLLARYTGMPACVVAGIELWDSAGSPRRLAWGALPQIAYTVVASTDVFTSSAHGMANNDPIQFLTGQSPTGLSAGTTYYVIAATTNTYQLSATVGGSAVNVTADGGGNVIKCKAVTAGDALEVASGALSVTVN